MIDDALTQEVCIEGPPSYAFENKLFSKMNTNRSSNLAISCNKQQMKSKNKL